MNDFGSIRDAVFRVAPRYAIAKVAVFSLYASDQARTGGDACLLLDVGCTFSRADAAKFRRDKNGLAHTAIGVFVDIDDTVAAEKKHQEELEAALAKADRAARPHRLPPPHKPRHAHAPERHSRPAQDQLRPP